MRLEVRALLMRLESRLVAEQLVEQELRRIFPGAADQEQFYAGLALRLRQEAAQDLGDIIGLSLLGLLLRDDQKAAAIDCLANRALVHGLLIHI